MLKSIAIALTTIIVTASGASALEVCSPKVSTGLEVSKSTYTGNFEPETKVGFTFVLGKTNCDRLKAEARAAEAEAKNAELEITKTQRENEEQSLDNLIKMVKAFDALNELCGETSNKAICYKADVLALEIANTK